MSDLSHLRSAVPEQIGTLMRESAASGGRVYLVGGALRDLIAGRVPYDWDLAADEVTTEFLSRSYPATPLGFGCVRLELDGGLTVELAMLRSDGASDDARHPTRIGPAATIEEDLARRDFTMNAIALGPTIESAVLIDPFDGRRDISRRLIRSVGDPDRSIRDDALRALRALRFVGELGWALDDATAHAIAHAPVESLSGKRIGDELLRILGAAHVDRAFDALGSLGLLARIAPELSIDAELPARLVALHGVGPRLLELTRSLPDERLGPLLDRWSLPRPLRARLVAERRLEAAIAAGGTDLEAALRLRLLAHREIGSPEAAAELLSRRIALGRAGAGELALLRLLLAPSLREAPVGLSGLALELADLPGGGAERGALIERLLLEVGAGRLPNEREALRRWISPPAP